MEIKVDKTLVRLINDDGSIYLERALLIEGAGLSAIYEDGYFVFVCGTSYDLGHVLATHRLSYDYIDDERCCSKCGEWIKEGFYFESDGTYYCSKTCLTKVISWARYLEIYDNGNGDGYWTSWEE